MSEEADPAEENAAPATPPNMGSCSSAKPTFEAERRAGLVLLLFLAVAQLWRRRRFVTPGT
jgi:hypothetical protein